MYESMASLAIGPKEVVADIVPIAKELLDLLNTRIKCAV